MDQADRDKIERAQNILRALDRTLRSQRLYSDNNPVLIRHQQELVNLFAQFFSVHDDLTVQIAPFELRVDEEMVYQNSHQQESLAFRLFHDGIRSIGFRSGVTAEEVLEFLTAFGAGRGAGTGDSDAVTSFWEKEFEHIRYTVADTFIEEGRSGEKTSEEKVAEVLDPGMTMYRGSGGEPEEDIYQDFNVTLSPSSLGKIFQQRCVLTQDEFDEIQRDLAESDRAERLTLDFVDMVLAVMLEEENKEDYLTAARALGEVLENNLLRGEIALARVVMEQIHRLPARPVALASSDPNIPQQTLKILWPPNRIDLFLQALNQDPKGTADDIEILVSLCDPTALPHFLKRVATVADPNRLRVVCAGLARLHRGDFGIFVPVLSSKEPDTVRIGLKVLAHIRNEKAVDLLPPLIQHRELSIRKEAISILRNFRTPKTFRLLMSLLADPNGEIRMLALRILSFSQDREIARQLTTAINREDFRHRSLQERKGYFHAVARIAGDDFIPFLRGILAARSWFRRSEQQERYQCATYALGVIGTPRAKDALHECTKSKNEAVRRLSQTALRILEGAASARELR